MFRINASLRTLANVVCATLLAACQGDRPAGLDESEPLELTVLAGNNQRGVVGEPLPLAVRVQLRRGGTAVAREMLAVQVTAGDGQLVAPMVMTDGGGRASMIWSLGTRSGDPQRLVIRYVDPTSGIVSTLASISADAIAGQPAKLVPLAPERQRALLGVPVDSVPAVRVLDRYANPVPNARVSFTAASAGALLSDSMVTTDSSGLARVRSWAITAPSTRSELVVRAAGGSAQVTFTASAFANIDLALLPDLPRIASGSSHTCALDSRGRVFCWGDNFYSALGAPGAFESTKPGYISKSATPRLVDSARTYSAVVSSITSACALETGTGRVYCWGSASSGELGSSATRSSAYASSVPLEAELPEPAVRLSAGGRTVCALTESGVAYCWGNNSEGQIGNGRYAGTRSTPAQAALGLRFVDITVGWLHTCGLRKDGSVYCWGTNEHFQLGWSGLARAAVAAPQLDLPQVISIAAGQYHTCAILADSTSSCWGGNFDGQLGDGTGWSSRTPVATKGGHQFTQLVAADGHTCGLRVDKRIYCWGVNDDGSLGDGTLITKVEPTALSGSRSYTALARRCAIADDKSMWCWGPNSFGQTSFGAAITPRTVPVRVTFP